MDADLPIVRDQPEDRRAIREDILRNQMVELTGAADGDSAVAEIFSKYGDEELRRRALDRYVKDGRTISEIAKELDVPERTVAAWAFVGKWNQPVAMELAVRQEEEAIQLARLRIRQRRDIVQKQLDSAQMVRDKVTDELDQMSAKTAAEALKAAADIEARALGMSESGRTDFMEKSDEEKKRKAGEKVPLVVVVQNASGSGIPVLGKKPEEKNEEAIDV